MNYTIFLPEYPEPDDFFIHPTAIIYPNVILGNNVHIGAYAIIGGAPEHRSYWDGNYKTVDIGDNVRISNHVTIDSGTEQNTIIGNNVVLLAKSHIGHDAVIGDDVTVSCGACIGGHSIIEDGCNIGLNAVIHQKQIIAEGCMIGMGAVVTKKLITEPYKIYAGNPAKYIGENLKHPSYESRNNPT